MKKCESGGAPGSGRPIAFGASGRRAAAPQDEREEWVWSGIPR
jgi:hypothetical protein